MKKTTKQFNTTLFAVTALFAGLFTTAANAENISASAKAGQKKALYDFYVFDSDTCWSAGWAKPSLRSTPNGKLSSSRIKQRATSGKCAGKIVQITRVYFTPNRGFRGTTKLRFGFNYPRYADGTGTRFYSVNASVTVK